MSVGKEEETKLPPHHEQLPLCTTRLPYRQGRKLTAVKVYSVNNESNHLLVFGVPSLSLRHEAKELLVRFGKLVQFHVTNDYPAEEFTETYHACYERIQSARIAKKMLDTRNFYGGSLHICYAPELETIQETRVKLVQRRKDIRFRLKNLQKETSKPSVVNSNLNANNETEYNVNNEIEYNVNNEVGCNVNVNNEVGYNVNVNNEVGCNVNVNNEVGYNVNVNNKVGYNFNVNSEVENNLNIRYNDSISESLNNEFVNDIPNSDVITNERKKLNMGEKNVIYVNRSKRKLSKDKRGKRSKPSFDRKDKSSNEESTNENGLDIVDCTSVDTHIVSNINEALNYRNFGNEVIRKVDLKPMNKIVFNFNKKT